MEQNSITTYVKDTAAYITKDNCCTIQYYNCHRSHSHQTKETCLRGSKKIGHACPLRIMCKVDYWKTHVGHENLIKYVRLDQNLIRNIEDQIKAGVDDDFIIKNIC
ncbi:uncharacterized protein LOC113371735 [Ctenocephalides felis]|uniref:uncharacterized protein LOC113371735 n=1 Tax=Ctenocephalides felis TaxID=7515 RepID=UPI000E6E42A5|nr:uncharacterized protein LOC113371735 [Ctenocephalides felis]